MIQLLELREVEGRLIPPDSYRIIRNDEKDGHYWYSKVYDKHFCPLVTLLFDGKVERYIPDPGIIVRVIS